MPGTSLPLSGTARINSGERADGDRLVMGFRMTGRVFHGGFDDDGRSALREGAPGEVVGQTHIEAIVARSVGLAFGGGRLGTRPTSMPTAFTVMAA